MNVDRPGSRPKVGLDGVRQPVEQRRRTNWAASACAAATVAATSSSTRPRVDRPSRQSTAATSIDTPMTLRMSTLRNARRPPPLMRSDCSRNRKANANTCHARRTARRPDFRLAHPPPHPGIRCQSHGHTGKEQEDRCTEAAKDNRPPIRRASAIGQPRPRIEGVRLDHDQNADAPQPVQVVTARRPDVGRGARRGWGPPCALRGAVDVKGGREFDVLAQASARPSSTSRVTAQSPVRRRAQEHRRGWRSAAARAAAVGEGQPRVHRSAPRENASADDGPCGGCRRHRRPCSRAAPCRGVAPATDRPRCHHQRHRPCGRWSHRNCRSFAPDDLDS